MSLTIEEPLTFGKQRTKKEKEYDEVVLARVKRGIAFCEKHYGPDWMDKIEVDELDLRSGACCILGQLEGEGGYVQATGRFWVDDRGPTRNGFSTASGDYSEKSWDQLQACWEDVLIPRVKMN